MEHLQRAAAADVQRGERRAVAAQLLQRGEPGDVERGKLRGIAVQDPQLRAGADVQAGQRGVCAAEVLQRAAAADVQRKKRRFRAVQILELRAGADIQAGQGGFHAVEREQLREARDVQRLHGIVAAIQDPQIGEVFEAVERGDGLAADIEVYHLHGLAPLQPAVLVQIERLADIGAENRVRERRLVDQDAGQHPDLIPEGVVEPSHPHRDRYGSRPGSQSTERQGIGFGLMGAAQGNAQDLILRAAVHRFAVQRGGAAQSGAPAGPRRRFPVVQRQLLVNIEGKRAVNENKGAAAFAVGACRRNDGVSRLETGIAAVAHRDDAPV